METTGSTPHEAAPPTGSAAQPAGRRDRNIAAVCVLLLLIGMPVGYLKDDPDTGGVIGMFVLIAVSLALMAWLVMWLVPRERTAGVDRATRTALILGVLAVLTSLVFWTGIPFAVGAGAIALGLSLRESAAPSDGRGKPTAAVALGALAVVASFVLLLFG